VGATRFETIDKERTLARMRRHDHDAGTIVATTVHERQVFERGVVPTTDHDIHVELIVPPDEVIECDRPENYRLPTLQWDQLADEKIASVPVLSGPLKRGARRPGRPRRRR
jgi:hypothetical protein